MIRILILISIKIRKFLNFRFFLIKISTRFLRDLIIYYIIILLFKCLNCLIIEILLNLKINFELTRDEAYSEIINIYKRD